MLAICQEDGVINQEKALNLLGSKFRVILGERVGPWETDAVSSS